MLRSLHQQQPGLAAERIRKWAFSFFTAVGGSQQNIDAEFVSLELSSDRGHGCGNQSYIIHDEDFRLKARKFVRSNCSNKGEPNLTALQFRELIEATFGVSVCNTTATVWLHHLGFSQKNHMKGVFFDGHDEEDVVEYRADFFKRLTELDKKTVVPGRPPPQLHEREKPPYMTSQNSMQMLIRVVSGRTAMLNCCDRNL